MKKGTNLFGILAMLFLFTACGAKEDIDNSENIPAESAVQIEKSSTEESSGSNLNWRGFLTWTELDEDMIVVSAQLTDWRKYLV